MGIVTGINAFRKREDEESTGSGVRYLKLADKQTVTLTPLDDLDNTDAVENGAGVAVIIYEHQAGQNFKVTAQCTKEDEGKCWACEKARSTPKAGWGRKKRLYLNVLVDDGKEDPYVAIWQMGTQKANTYDLLVEEFIDNGTIAGNWRLRRTGTTVSDTKYSLKRLGDTDVAYSDYERFDLASIRRVVPYAEQAAYYGGDVDDVQEDDDSADW